MPVEKIIKRNGDVVRFDKRKITYAIFKAAKSVGGTDKKIAEELTEKVVRILESSNDNAPSVEDVQDGVEKVLIENGHARTAKAYILYRQERSEIRKEKARILEKTEIDEVDKIFDLNALRVLKSRYLNKDEEGKLTESPKELFTRVAVHDTLPHLLYDPRFYSKNSSQRVHAHETFDSEIQEKIFIGKYKLNKHHLEALKKMYDRMNRNGQMKLPWSDFFHALRSNGFARYEKEITEYYDMMIERKFMPNTPAIANFGTRIGMGSACFVLDVGDSMEDIMDTLKATAIIHKCGGGTGFNFSNLRPEGDYISSTKGTSSGPLSFMRLFDTMTEVVKQGGIRRGANMGIMNINHPDIEKFITAKEGNKSLRNFNISVLILSDFWDYYENNEPYPLLNPRNGEVVRYVNPRMLFDRLVYQAWESAEPGVIFYDTVNKYNPFYDILGPIVTTNPCGEVLLYPNEPCNLGSINVWAFVKEDENGSVEYDWDELAETVHKATRFLDNVIDVNKWPLKQIEEMALATRKIGLGVMGVGDLLFDMGIPYNTEEGREFMSKIMEFINYHSKLESIALYESRGPLPYYDKSFYTKGMMPFAGFDHKSTWKFNWKETSEQAKKGIRNGFTTVIAPTGSISMIAGCSSGIEPVYSLVFEKNVKVGSFYYVNPVFERVMKREGLFDEKLMEDIMENKSSINGINYIPERLRRIFVTAMDITPEDHVRAQATFQQWTDSSISKTNNFPSNASVDNIRESYLLAYKLGCKGITVYRDASIKEQVLVAATKDSEKKVIEAQARIEEKKKVDRLTNEKAQAQTAVKLPAITMHSIEGTKPQNCPECNTDIQMKEGCVTCPQCGWGLCS